MGYPRHWPCKPGPQPANRIGTLADQIRQALAPRSKRPTNRLDRRIEVVEVRQAEIERLIAVMMINQRGQ
jgi:hypothetical protein